MRADILVRQQRCRDILQSGHLEWLDTNGSGAYAMGTVAGLRTRRYHSLLNAPIAPGQPTQVWLNAIEDILRLDGQDIELAVHQYPGVLAPRGFEYLSEFRLAPYPCWLYHVGETTLLRELLLLENRSAVLVRYCCSDNATISLRPFIAGRPHHSLLRADSAPGWQSRSGPGHLSLSRPDAALYFRGDFTTLHDAPDWYRNFQYPVDQARGLDFEEDLFTPGQLHVELRADTWAYLVCSLNDDPGPLDPFTLIQEITAKEQRFPAPHSLMDHLSNSAEQFVFDISGRKSVIAGYPWFTDWGRDTLISLPGLFLARNRVEDAGRAIAGFLDLRQHGLVPNRITDDGSTPEYNSIDASLWTFVAVSQWLEAGGSQALFQDVFFPALREMLLRISQGTIYGIHRDSNDGLLHAGEPGTQLTWMDARVDGRAITPRVGKPVEINALYYNALRLMTDWARSRGDFPNEASFSSLANETIAGFTASFWNENQQCLYDLLTEDGPDPAIRPNQLFALSLPYPLVIRSKGEAILSAVDQHLLTPQGLRTLAPMDPAYRGRFEGGPLERDSAYHQGTVWPWLFGPYARACLRFRPDSPEEKQRLRNLLTTFATSSLESGCLGHLAEVFDGDEPRREGGTPAQAWSTAEILAVLRQELAS